MDSQVIFFGKGLEIIFFYKNCNCNFFATCIETRIYLGTILYVDVISTFFLSFRFHNRHFFINEARGMVLEMFSKC
jgi:hypothetical protein